jgi:divalent metal cation (Fe/Co/Zn/Cd) transporter
VAIAASKYIAALLTGSSAMMAEAFHTTVDTGNELLLVIGIKRSERPPDELHPLGTGSSLFLFVAGSGLHLWYRRGLASHRASLT